MVKGFSIRRVKAAIHADGHRAVDDAVVGRERHRHDGANPEFAVDDDGPLGGGADGQDAGLRRVEDGRELGHPEHPEVGHREAAAFELGLPKPSGTSRLRKVGDAGSQHRHRGVADVAQDRCQQPVVHRDLLRSYGIHRLPQIKQGIDPAVGRDVEVRYRGGRCAR